MPISQTHLHLSRFPSWPDSGARSAGYAHQYQCSITESMRFLVSEYHIKLGDAKNQVSSHPVWHDVMTASKLLHDNLVEWFNESSSGGHKI